MASRRLTAASATTLEVTDPGTNVYAIIALAVLAMLIGGALVFGHSYLNQRQHNAQPPQPPTTPGVTTTDLATSLAPVAKALDATNGVATTALATAEKANGIATKAAVDAGIARGLAAEKPETDDSGPKGTTVTTTNTVTATASGRGTNHVNNYTLNVVIGGDNSDKVSAPLTAPANKSATTTTTTTNTAIHRPPANPPAKKASDTDAFFRILIGAYEGWVRAYDAANEAENNAIAQFGQGITAEVARRQADAAWQRVILAEQRYRALLQPARP